MPRFTDQLRRAIATSGLTLSEIARRTDIDLGQLSRFYHGKCGIGMERTQALIDLLGLELVARSEVSRGKREAHKRAKKTRKRAQRKR